MVLFILEDEYGLEMTVDIEGGLNEMCNLSGLIEENAIKKTNVEKSKI